MQNSNLQLRCFNAFKYLPSNICDEIYQQLKRKEVTQASIGSVIDKIIKYNPSLKNNTGFRTLQLIKTQLTSNQHVTEFINAIQQYHAEQELLYQLDSPQKIHVVNHLQNSSNSVRNQENSPQGNKFPSNQQITSKLSNVSQYLYQNSYQNIDNQNLTLSSEILNDGEPQKYDIGFLDEIDNVHDEASNNIENQEDIEQLQALKYSQLQQLCEKRKQKRMQQKHDNNDFAELKSQTKIDTLLQFQTPSHQDIVKSGSSNRDQIQILANTESDEVIQMIDKIQENIEKQQPLQPFNEVNNSNVVFEKLKEFENKNQMFLFVPQNSEHHHYSEVEDQQYHKQQMAYHELRCDLEMKKIHVREKLNDLQSKLNICKGKKMLQIAELQKEVRPKRYQYQQNHRQLMLYIDPQFNKLNVTFALILKRYQHLKRVIIDKQHQAYIQDSNREKILQQLQIAVSKKENSKVY